VDHRQIFQSHIPRQFRIPLTHRQLGQRNLLSRGKEKAEVLDSVGLAGPI
jgi:hypothetical protein